MDHRSVGDLSLLQHLLQTASIGRSGLPARLFESVIRRLRVFHSVLLDFTFVIAAVVVVVVVVDVVEFLFFDDGFDVGGSWDIKALDFDSNIPGVDVSCAFIYVRIGVLFL